MTGGAPPSKVIDHAIQKFQAQVAEFDARGVTHELGRRPAFQRLLEDTARPLAGWLFVHEDALKVKGKLIRPDGLLRDDFGHRRGFWEAKDLQDDLDAAVRAKLDAGYPTTNIIFENSRAAILIQDGARTRFDLQNTLEVAALLRRFYAHTEKPIEEFKQAVAEFGERVPELGTALKTIIDNALATDPKFQGAFATFLQLCRDAINPDLRQEAVVEMVIQHLLTERIIRKVFHNADFGHRNVIAREIETVIDALTSRSFSRDQFLKSLDPFYHAIEGSFALREDFREKQTFLNTLYERFFQGFAVKAADTHGIVYTPQEIVDFMVNSVAEVLEREFGKTLGAPGVTVLDPCTGTGNFIVNMLGKIPGEHLEGAYRERLFANEVMLMPYYIASLNIEHAFAERMGRYEAFEGLCFVDTLEMAKADQTVLMFMSEANTQRVERQKKATITVIIGNPPYNANQVNENDNNKNRVYEVVDNRIRHTYVKYSYATLKNKLYDPYIKFIRWATDRLAGRDGIVCFVTNNSFVVDGTPFDGVRKNLLSDFTQIYHIDLHGNVRQNPKLSGTTHNVFGIQVGVGITIAIRRSSGERPGVYYHRVPEQSRKEAKLAWLGQMGSASRVEWQVLTPDDEHNWIITPCGEEFNSFAAIGSKQEDSLFHRFSTGAKSNRDDVVYDFQRPVLAKRAEQFIEDYNSEIDRYNRKKTQSSSPLNIDLFVDLSRIKWSSTLKLHLQRGNYGQFDKTRIRECLYRPFTKLSLYYDDLLNDRPGLFRFVFPNPKSEQENLVICTTNHSQMPFNVQISNRVANEAVGGRAGHCFPFYTYAEDGTNRRENITDWALAHFQAHYGDPTITKWDIFYYVYAVLHHPEYRRRFAEVLKKELPRIPLLDDFATFARVGCALAQLHVEYETVEPWPGLRWDWTPGVPVSWQVEKMVLAKDKTALKVNDSLTLANIPSATAEYRLGNRSALEWVVDQYQVDRDKATRAVTSDPNRPEQPDYIAQLAARVVTVSVRTVELVSSLPPWPAPLD